MYFLVIRKSEKNIISLLSNCLRFRSPSAVFSPLIRMYADDRKLNEETIRLLEKLSFVNFENEKHVTIVEEAIKFADTLKSVNTDNVEPLITVLENRSLRLRDDVVTEGNCQKEILCNAKVVEEDYFVAPPGNIPITEDTSKE